MIGAQRLEQLQRDRPIEPRVDRLEHTAEAALSDLAQDPERTPRRTAAVVVGCHGAGGDRQGGRGDRRCRRDGRFGRQ
jgi:hypothetical protein